MTPERLAEIKKYLNPTQCTNIVRLGDLYAKELLAHVDSLDARLDAVIEHRNRAETYCCALEESRDEARAQRDAATARVRELETACNMVLRRWTFDDDQQHTHTWHDWADCADAIRAALTAPGGGGKGGA